jgi:hypothetical protein
MPPKRKFPKPKWKRGLCQQRGCDLRVRPRGAVRKALGRTEGRRVGTLRGRRGCGLAPSGSVEQYSAEIDHSTPAARAAARARWGRSY